MRQVLFSDDFKSFKLGDYPYEPLLSAMGQYHYRPQYWYGGQWYDPSPQSRSGGIMFWMIADTEEGGKCIEYAGPTLHTEEIWQMMLVTGKTDWTDYDVTGRVRVLRMKNVAGIAFRYQNSKEYYLLALSDGKLRLIRHDMEDIVTLKEVDIDYDVDHFYKLSATVEKDNITCFFEGRKMFTVKDGTYPCGKIALGTLAPVQFTDIKVTMDSKVYEKVTKKRAEEAIELANEQAKYPKPLLWKVLNLRDFGCGRSVRFGHLNKGKKTFMVFAQNQRRIQRDAYARISCLTAMDLDGNVLWQIGETNPDNGAFITCDLPLQIYDIDGDGEDEVIYARDFKVIIADGHTGKTKKWVYTPYVKNIGSKDAPFDRLNVDIIRFCNFSGKDRPTDILIKDRYSKLVAYDSDLNELWQYDSPVDYSVVPEKKMGHWPHAYDFNGDGRDELFIGFDLISADGKKIWGADVDRDHTDGSVVGKFDPDGEPRIAIVSGWEGFMMLDFDGNILLKRKIGHAQRICVGKFRTDLKGLQMITVTYHRNQGILNFFDCEGNRLWSSEPGSSGNILVPVNWMGDGTDLILLNGNNKFGGMIDGYGRRVVIFPDDGHPDLCCEALDLTGDGRDEIILWDKDRMFIYTQDNVVKGDVHSPRRYPTYNASNYRGEYAYRD